jgi:hypothetical protein
VVPTAAAVLRRLPRCLPAIAAAGNHLIVEHVIEFLAWRRDLARCCVPHRRARRSRRTGPP